MKKKIGGADEPQPEAELLPYLHVAYPGNPELHADWIKNIAKEITTRWGTRSTGLPSESLGFISAHGSTTYHLTKGPKYTVIPENINIIFYSEGGGRRINIGAKVDANRYSYYRGGALCEEYLVQFYPGYDGVGTYSMRGVYSNDKKITLTGSDNIIADIKGYWNDVGLWTSNRKPLLTTKMRESFEREVGEDGDEEDIDQMTEEFKEDARCFSLDKYKNHNANLFKYFYEDPWDIINMAEAELRPELTEDESDTLTEICEEEGPEMRSNPRFTWNGPKRKFSDILKLLSAKKAEDPSLPDYYICNFCRGVEDGVEVGMEPLSKCGELYGDHDFGLDVDPLPLLSTTAVELPGELRRDSSLASSNALNYFREILNELVDYGTHDMPWYGRLLEICEQIDTPAVAGHVPQHGDVYLDRDQVCFVLQLRHTLSKRAVV